MDEIREMQTEFVNYAELPIFDDNKDNQAVNFMDEQEAAALKEMEEEAQRQMAAAQEDPTTQNYFMREDRRTVVKDDKEYMHCLKSRIPMKVIPYGHALQLLKEEEARAKQRLKDKRKKKAAKKARKKNRK